MVQSRICDRFLRGWVLVTALYAGLALADTSTASLCRLNDGLYGTVVDPVLTSSVEPVASTSSGLFESTTSSSSLSLEFIKQSSTTPAIPWATSIEIGNLTAANATSSVTTPPVSAPEMSLSSNCSSYLDALIAYCTHLASGYGTMLSPKLGLANSSANMSDGLLYPFVFETLYIPSSNCSNTVPEYNSSSDFETAFIFQGKSGLDACFDMYSFSECQTSSCM